jgi:hypothetical protein
MTDIKFFFGPLFLGTSTQALKDEKNLTDSEIIALYNITNN